MKFQHQLKKNKKYDAQVDGSKTASFGQEMASDFTKHKNPYRKQAYIACHKKNEDWTRPGAKAAGFYSKHVLWNTPTLKASVDDINERFQRLTVKLKKNSLNIYRVVDKLPSKYNSTYL